MDPRRRGRGELDRTPPDYQVVIKFLLMASLLAASTSLQGRSTGCGLMRPSEEADEMRGASRAPVPEDAREPLQSLGLAEEWQNLEKSASRRRGLVTKVVAVLMFNTMVIWSDMGQAVFQHKPSPRRSCPVLEPVLRAVSGVSEANQTYWGCAAGLEVLTHANVSAGMEPVCIASEAAARGTCLEEKMEGAKVTPWVEAVWAQLGDSDVPWWAHLAALGLLVAAVVWIPKCPEVLEITCPVLVT